MHTITRSGPFRRNHPTQSRLIFHKVSSLKRHFAMWLILQQIYPSLRIFQLNGVNFQAQSIFRGFSDECYYRLKKSIKFTRSTNTAKILLMTQVNCRLYILFTIVGLQRLMNHNFAKIFKLPKSRGHVLSLNVKNSVKNTNSDYLQGIFQHLKKSKCFLILICIFDTLYKFSKLLTCSSQGYF